MNILQSIVLGLIQGITEFFPISSSGHLVIIPYFSGWDYPPLYFTVTVHFATLLAVLTVLYRDAWRIIRGFALGLFKRQWRKSIDFKMGLYIIIATIPAVLMGLFLNDLIESIFSKPLIVAVFLLVTAFILWGGEYRGRKVKQKKSLAYLSSVASGIGQALAVFPGISRTGSTISFARFFGVRREETVRFSFLLSIPIILGSFVFELSRSTGTILSGGENTVWVLFAGLVSAYLSGFFAIKYLLYLTKKKNLNIFAVYCICLSIAIFVFYIINNII
ncbi:MAG: undecaprenyl-diphosphatase [Actinobacteria bacterium]|nr:undecaprenyl-diphosphatase [Actinomycetota bacterium]